MSAASIIATAGWRHKISPPAGCTGHAVAAGPWVRLVWGSPPSRRRRRSQNGRGTRFIWTVLGVRGAVTRPANRPRSFHEHPEGLNGRDKAPRCGEHAADRPPARGDTYSRRFPRGVRRRPEAEVLKPCSCYPTASSGAATSRSRSSPPGTGSPPCTPVGSSWIFSTLMDSTSYEPGSIEMMRTLASAVRSVGRWTQFWPLPGQATAEYEGRMGTLRQQIHALIEQK